MTITTTLQTLLDRLDEGPNECANKPDSGGHVGWKGSFLSVIEDVRAALNADIDVQTVREASASTGVHRNLAAADIADRLRPAFEAVQNKENWKFPIDALVQPDNLADTIVAIEFFTGGKTTASFDGERKAFHITSPGYYVSVGA